MSEIIEINTDNFGSPEVGDNLYINRSAITNFRKSSTGADVTISVQAYNNLEKTKICVSSILKNTANINYDLILIDNGSTDGTFEYFESVPYEQKTIMHISKNVGAFFPILELQLSGFGQFFCTIANDIIVTPHWLENLLICMKSDPTIGMVNPLSSNTSNLQGYKLLYRERDYDDMQKQAEKFNVSDPKKWEERLRMVTLGTLYRKSALYAIGWPLCDVGFFHDFADDDITFRMRRAGYKAVLAGDTWICHDHDYRTKKDPAELQKSLDSGRKNFMDKYFGVDAWEDVNNYYIYYFSHFPAPPKVNSMSVLGIDVKCGTPILDIKNWLRTYGIFNTTLSAFTQDAKYWLDLKTICKGPVICDREEFLCDCFPAESFDIVLADNAVNRYHEPVKILRDMFTLCKRGGYVFCRLLNSYSFIEYLNLLGEKNVYNPNITYNITFESFFEVLKNFGDVLRVINVGSDLSPENQKELASMIPKTIPADKQKEAASRMQIKEFIFVIQKR